jgi:hypothetical protein
MSKLYSIQHGPGLTSNSCSINIGNARIQGLEADLNMTGVDYNIALFTFFILYILLEVSPTDASIERVFVLTNSRNLADHEQVPCNLILKKIRPSIFIPSIMVGWGIVTICQGLTRSFAGLVVCRVIIGALEAGFFPGCLYLISMYDGPEAIQ